MTTSTSTSINMDAVIAWREQVVWDAEARGQGEHSSSNFEEPYAAHSAIGALSAAIDYCMLHYRDVDLGDQTVEDDGLSAGAKFTGVPNDNGGDDSTVETVEVWVCAREVTWEVEFHAPECGRTLGNGSETCSAECGSTEVEARTIHGALEAACAPLASTLLGMPIGATIEVTTVSTGTDFGNRTGQARACWEGNAEFGQEYGEGIVAVTEQ
jgi:hypothetical protein